MNPSTNAYPNTALNKSSNLVVYSKGSFLLKNSKSRTANGESVLFPGTTGALLDGNFFTGHTHFPEKAFLLKYSKKLPCMFLRRHRFTLRRTPAPRRGKISCLYNQCLSISTL